MDMMIHDFDMARFVAGSEVEEVYAQGNVLINPVFAEHGDVDTAIVTLRFRMVLSVSSITAVKRYTAMINGLKCSAPKAV